MNEILPQIVNHLRVSLITFILQSQKIGKDKLVEMIDGLAISEKRSVELKKLFKEDIAQFKDSLLKIKS